MYNILIVNDIYIRLNNKHTNKIKWLQAKSDRLLGAYILGRLLEEANLMRGDVQIVPANESRHATLYMQNKADAFITFEPFKSGLAALGAHAIFDSRNMPNEIFDVMLVHEDVFQSRRKDVCDVARQWFRVLEYVKQSPAEAEARMAGRFGVSVQEYRAMAGGIVIPGQQENLRLLAGKEPAIEAPARNLAQVMLNEGQLKSGINIRLALDAGIESCLSR